MKKYKMTGCARFVIVLLILAPLAFIGASYYNGEDGIQKIKDLFGGASSSSTTSDRPSNNGNDVKKLEDALDDSRKENDELKTDIKDLQEELKDKEQEIESLRGGQ